MIRKLKTKFIILSMTSLLALLTTIVVGMNLINYNSLVLEADGILSLLSQNKGAFPEPGGDKDGRLPPDMSPELPYESRYFSVLLDSDGDVIHTETSRIAAVDPGMAIDFAEQAAKESSDRGFVENFRYVRSNETGATRLTFLDCGRRFDSFRAFLLASSGMALAGFVIVFSVIVFFAGRIIRPIAESYEKQKRFITDAGHEIKTPLTIINANVDLLEMELDQNECLDDIRQQTSRLTSLTNDLVLLARMEESGNTMQMIDFPISEVIAEAAMPFNTLAQSQRKSFSCNIQPLLSMRGNDKAITQLVSILMDNALKYTPQDGTVSLSFTRQAKNLILTVFNTTETEITGENLDRVFDRFYRIDPSRNSETGGHGIGLSVAKAITAAHGGKIRAWTQDGRSFAITVTLPS